MANVLIGIIGVILFIGLALAGANFLGPKFNEASANTTAVQVSEVLSQTVSAYKLRKATTGSGTPVGSLMDLLNEGYLKSRPLTVFVRGAGGDDTIGVETKLIVVLSDYAPDAADDRVCVAFAKMTDMATVNVVRVLADAPSNKRAGCFKSSVAWGGSPAGTHVYFHRV